MIDDVDRLCCYQYLSWLIAGRQVLEIGCGSGDGSVLLAQEAATVWALACAEDRPKPSQLPRGITNLQFVIGQPDRLQLADGYADVVIVPELQRWIGRGALLPELQRVLKADGVAVFIVPNADAGVPQGVHYRRLLGHLSRFAHVRVCGVIPFWGRTVADFEPADSWDPALDCSLVEEDELPDCYLALCSRQPLEAGQYTVLQVPAAAPSPRIDDASRSLRPESAELTRLYECIAELEAARQADRWRVDELNGRLRESEARLAELQRELEMERDRVQHASMALQRLEQLRLAAASKPSPARKARKA